MSDHRHITIISPHTQGETRKYLTRDCAMQSECSHRINQLSRRKRHDYFPFPFMWPHFDAAHYASLCLRTPLVSYFSCRCRQFVFTQCKSLCSPTGIVVGKVRGTRTRSRWHTV